MDPRIASDRAFFIDLPKIELHAHLTGSIRAETLHEIWDRKKDRVSLDDPLEVFKKAREEMDVNTFFALFSKYIYQLCSSKENIQFSTNAVLHDFQKDGVAYLELRTIPRMSNDMSKDEYVRTVLSVINDFDRSKMSTYLILGVDRKNTLEEALETVDLAVKYKSQGVVGVDLCGNPAKGDVNIFGDAFAKAREHGLKVTLHFAEVAFSSTEDELQALLSYKPQRLGHVINVPDAIKDEIIKRKIGLELCLTCNIDAQLISGSFADHHFSYWEDKGCPLAICTDDVGIFGSPVSNEYALLAKHFNLDHHRIFEIARGAGETIFGPEQEKERLQNLFGAFASSHGLR